MSAGGKPNNEYAGVGVAESWDTPRPVRPIPEGRPLLDGNGFSVLNKPWTETASGYLFSQRC